MDRERVQRAPCRMGRIGSGRLGFVLWVGAAACAPAKRIGPPTFVGRAAVGRPVLCPDGAVDPLGNGVPAPDAQRCSYAGVAGGALVEVRGRVASEPYRGAPGDALAGAEIVIWGVDKRDGSPSIVARGRADAQGSFSIGAVLPPGRYQVGVARAPATARTLEIEAGAAPDPVVLIVPRAVATED